MGVDTAALYGLGAIVLPMAGIPDWNVELDALLWTPLRSNS